MSAYVCAVEHPFFAVSAPTEDSPSRVCRRGNYVLEGWHEVFGRRTVDVTVTAAEQAIALLTYQAK